MVGAANPKYSGPDTDGSPTRGPGGGSPRAASISVRRAATWRTTAVHGADAVGPTQFQAASVSRDFEVKCAGLCFTVPGQWSHMGLCTSAEVVGKGSPVSGRSRSSSAVSLNSGASPPSQISHTYVTRASGFLRRKAPLNLMLPLKRPINCSTRNVKAIQGAV